MNSRNYRPTTLPMRVFLIASAATAIGALIIAARRVPAHRAAAPENAPAALLAPPGPPITGEAQVFRTRPVALAIEPTPGPRRAAHPRTLATFRSLRAYPGAPPRIPHGLTPGEFRMGGCKTCHERGGYSLRFDAYVPITPHPEMGACLQCHVGDAKLMAIALPSTDPSARCHQCHDRGGAKETDSTLHWTADAWPRLARTSRTGSPPPIPHELQQRGNCLSCHAGPSGVIEIQTRHPERANCRQCHIAAGNARERFARPARGTGHRVEGAP